MSTWCKEPTHWKRPWCWERLRAGGEGDDRGWDGWMASSIRWAWIWVNSRSWWWTGRTGMLRFMGLQRVRHDWVTELNWKYVWKKLPIRKRSLLKWYYLWLFEVEAPWQDIMTLLLIGRWVAQGKPRAQLPCEASQHRWSQRRDYVLKLKNAMTLSKLCNTT